MCPHATTPIDIYKLFVTDEIIEKMVEETNKYAENCKQNTRVKAKSRTNAWCPTNYSEMCKFMGALITMGLVKVPLRVTVVLSSLRCYWSKKKLFRNAYIISLISDRFMLLLKFWHFSSTQVDWVLWLERGGQPRNRA